MARTVTTTTDPQRSRTMRAVKSKDTTPEMIVRRLVHSLGYRYRLHRRDLPGCPDLVFGPRRKIIFVHGCFWHQHDCPRGARSPKSNQDYWVPKLQRNRCRDEENLILLAELNWRVLVIWECETKDRKALGARINLFLEE
jgi:DNA mismatch endonuclease, patch repair protein